jgi:copper chaperone CopZ
MKLFITLTALFFVSTLSLAQEGRTESEKITSVLIEVEGMACQEGCADKISSNLIGTPGITTADVSYLKKEALVKFNPNIISLSDIKSIITNTKVKDYTYTIVKTTIKEE